MILALILACDSSAPQGPPDDDRDGFPADVDCDDADATAFPGGVEFCDGVDNDCNGEVDEGVPWGAQLFYSDDDDDGFGSGLVEACEQPDGTVRSGGDCDDADPERFPGRTEICNGLDDDCDGDTDEFPAPVYYADVDADGFGDPNSELYGCDPAPTWVLDATDCDDAEAAIHPGAEERCNGLDDNCDGLVDDEDAAVVDPPTWFVDADGDGHGSEVFSIVQCEPPPGQWAPTDDDCDDADATAWPGATEFCDGVDQDCDGVADGPDTPFLPGPRVPISVLSTQATTSPWATATVDLGALFLDAGGAGSAPAEVRFAAGDCLDGFLEFPASFVDGWESLTTAGAVDDRVGVLGISADTDGLSGTEDPLEVGAVDGWLYFAAGGAGDVVISPSAISAGPLSASFDPAMRLTDLSWRGQTLATQDFLLAGVVKVDGPVTTDVDAVVSVESEGALGLLEGSAASGGLSWSVSWWQPAGRPVLYGRVLLVAESTLALEGSEDWRTAITGFALGPSGVPSSSGEDVIYTTAVGALGVRVIGAPDAATITAVEGGFSIVGTDLPGTGSPTGIVDSGAVLSEVTVVLVPGDDVESVAAGLAQLDGAVSLGF